MSIFIDEYSYSPAAVRYDKKFPHKKLLNHISANDYNYDLLLNSFRKYLPNFLNISLNKPDLVENPCPFWNNGSFSSLDAISLYSILANTNPDVYLEIGSGNSTKFARQSILDHSLQTKIISIDPAPREQIDKICDLIIRIPAESISNEFYNSLPSSSVVFIDNSHRCFENSDVMMFFLEILPSLKKGVVIGIHDIFLPYDYPQSWIDENRHYNEQYMLASYLLGGGNDINVYFPTNYISMMDKFDQNTNYLYSKVNQPLGILTPLHGSSFWLLKRHFSADEDLQKSNAFYSSLLNKINTYLDIGNDRFHHLLRNGWSVLEHWGVWSNDHKSIISFDPHGLPEFFILKLYFRAFVSELHRTQRLSFSSNNLHLGHVTATFPDAEYSVSLKIKRDLMKSDNNNIDIFIDIPDAVCPVELGYSADPRKLGLGLYAVEFLDSI